MSAVVVVSLLFAGCGGDADQRLIVGQLASDRIELTAEATEPVVEILVAEGESVSAGQLLMRQDTARAEARLAEADAVLGQAGARLDELVRGPRSELIDAARADVAGATDELTFREADYARVKEVHARKLASPELLDQARAALDSARADLDVRRARLQELLTGTTVEELAQAEYAVKQAQARRDQLAADLGRHEIRAPVGCIVDSRLFEIGERPAPGQALMVMLAGTQPYARVYVPERLRVRVTPGDSATIHVDGLPDSLPGRVRWVASEAAFTPYYALTERDRGHLTYLAKIDIAVDRERLPDGVPVQVELLPAPAE
jgi:HlyD family secretion protein